MPLWLTSVSIPSSSGLSLELYNPELLNDRRILQLSQSLLHQVQVWNKIILNILLSNKFRHKQSLNPFFIRSRFGTGEKDGRPVSIFLDVSIPSSSGLGLELTILTINAQASDKSQSLLHQVQVWNVGFAATVHDLRGAVSIPSSSGLGLERSTCLRRQVGAVIVESQSLLHQVQVWNDGKMASTKFGRNKSQSLLHQVQVWNSITANLRLVSYNKRSQSLLHQVQVWNRLNLLTPILWNAKKVSIPSSSGLGLELDTQNFGAPAICKAVSIPSSSGLGLEQVPFFLLKKSEGYLGIFRNLIFSSP